jgi:hypothetical protein
MVLGVEGSRPIEACVVNMSSNGLQVRVPAPIPCDTLVKIDAESELILGKVHHCALDGGAYRVGIQLSAPLSSLMELELLNRALIGEVPAAKVGSSSGLREEKSLDPQSSKV